jgi:hypothetical protein
MSYIYDLIDKGHYFAINRPRQYGKTTTLATILFNLSKSEDFLPIFISFEGLGDKTFDDGEAFSQTFLHLFSERNSYKKSSYIDVIELEKQNAKSLKLLSNSISKIVDSIDKKIVLMIDEVDSAGNHDLFIKFLAMLRDKYISASMGLDSTFHNVILCGLYDVKSLKLKIRNDSQSEYNSPWNIAIDFTVDMSFNPDEITTMLSEYTNETGTTMDIESISQRLHLWTSGYPFLVSKLCKIIAETILSSRDDKNWTTSDVDNAVVMLLREQNTLFDHIMKTLENDSELHDFLQSIALGYSEYNFKLQNPNINLAYMHGFINRSPDDKLQIHNKIYEEYITDYFVSKRETCTKTKRISSVQDPYIKPDGRLDLKKVMLKFQEAIMERYSNDVKSEEFLEKELRLLFLMFLQPIINGTGFSFKEAHTGAEKRLDIVITFLDERFIVELKLWYGAEYHERGKKQLLEYMRLNSIKNGYMLIANKNQYKEFKTEDEDGIFMVWV